MQQNLKQIFYLVPLYAGINHYLVSDIQSTGAPPTITEGPTSKVVVELENTGFICRVKGGPQPDVFWTKSKVDHLLYWFSLFLLHFLE